jgi:hypothetical protein
VLPCPFSGELRAWDLRISSPAVCYALRSPRASLQPINDFRFVDTTLVAATEDGLLVWDARRAHSTPAAAAAAAESSLDPALLRHTYSASPFLCLDYNGRRAVCGAADAGIVMFDVVADTMMHRFARHRAGVARLRMLPEQMLSLALDGTVKVQ